MRSELHPTLLSQGRQMSTYMLVENINLISIIMEARPGCKFQCDIHIGLTRLLYISKSP